MKAIVRHRYGSPDVLELADVATPVPADGEVLIKVLAASVNPFDWHMMRGTPFAGRIAIGLRAPRSERLGADVAGRVEAVGKNVTRFKAGDEVFGAARGSFAEYVCTPEKALASKPANVTFEEAAAVPIGGLTALQGLRNRGKIQAGHKVLINGAAGGVGTFAVQIAKSYGAEVVGVCSTRNVEMVQSIGAGRVIDYTREDLTKGTERYDLILDCIGNHSVGAFRRLLTPNGIYVAIGGISGRWLAPIGRMLGTLLVSPFVRPKVTAMGAKLNRDDLALLGELMEGGKVKPVIDRRYPLSETAEAMRYVEGGHARGKVVITTG